MIVAYRTSDLPPYLRERLPDDAEPHRCLFFLYGKPNEAASAMWSELPEPPIGHASEGMALAQLVLGLFQDHYEIVKGLFPASVPEHERTKFGFGFHSGDADEVRAFLEARDRVVSLEEFSRRVHVLRGEGNAPLVLVGRGVLFPHTAGEGLHTFWINPSQEGPALAVSAAGMARLQLDASNRSTELAFEPFDPAAFPPRTHVLRVAGVDAGTALTIRGEHYEVALHPLGEGQYLAANLDPGPAELITSPGGATAKVVLPEAPALLEATLA